MFDKNQTCKIVDQNVLYEGERGADTYGREIESVWQVKSECA